MKLGHLIVAVGAALLASVASAQSPAEIPAGQKVRNVVLVHGAFVDGSGWRGVYDRLSARGYRVSIVQNPLTSLEDDISATTRILDRQEGPAILVGHSWGGTIITAAGNHPNVAGLVYVSARAPDAGETTADQYKGYPVASEFFLDVGKDGFGFVRADKFQSGFAADVKDADAAFLRDSQLPIRMSAFETRLTNAAWRSHKSWAVIFKDDRAFGKGMLHGDVPSSRCIEHAASDEVRE